MPMTWTPRWIPPSPVFWDYFTTIGFFAAAAAILSGIMARLASRLLTAEILGFQILVWIPKLVAGPHDHFNWAGNGISIALCGAPWVVSDSIGRTVHRGAEMAPARTLDMPGPALKQMRDSAGQQK
jgi:uncharacterized membrane protein YphA (DoxX/SURF4 family)